MQHKDSEGSIAELAAQAWFASQSKPRIRLRLSTQPCRVVHGVCLDILQSEYHSIREVVTAARRRGGDKKLWRLGLIDGDVLQLHSAGTVTHRLADPKTVIASKDELLAHSRRRTDDAEAVAKHLQGLGIDLLLVRTPCEFLLLTAHHAPILFV